MDEDAVDMGDLSCQLDVQSLMVAIAQGDRLMSHHQVAHWLSFRYCDRHRRYGIIRTGPDKMREIVTADAIEVIGTCRQGGGYQLPVGIGRQLLHTLVGSVEDIEPTLERRVSVSTGGHT